MGKALSELFIENNDLLLIDSGISYENQISNLLLEKKLNLTKNLLQNIF